VELRYKAVNQLENQAQIYSGSREMKAEPIKSYRFETISRLPLKHLITLEMGKE
jgi:hypothetical protein